MASLKELNEQRQAAAAELKELGKVTGEAWTAEHEGKWQEANKRFDEIQASMTAEQTRLERDASVQQRLAEIEAINKRAMNDGRVGFDAGRRREENPVHVAQIDTRAIALQAWLRAGRGMELTAEQRDACRKAGVNPGSTEFEMRNDYVYGGPSWCLRGGQKVREFRVGLDVATGGAGQAGGAYADMSDDVPF
jgi:HK97 family phage major capsid protein